MVLADIILEKIKASHRGKENAIKRLYKSGKEGLLDYLYSIGAIDEISESTDRKVRAIIEEYPIICSCEDGYYVAKGGQAGFEDVEYSIKYITKKAFPLLKKIRKKKEAYPQYYRGEQMELF